MIRSPRTPSTHRLFQRKPRSATSETPKTKGSPLLIQLVMSAIPPINILIANEQAQEAKEVTLSLRAFFPDSRIEVAYSIDEVVQGAAKCEWHTILADVDLFRQSGLATLTEIKRQAPMATIIIQADCNDMTLGMQVLRFGADFYLSKNSPAFLTELAFVLRTLLKNQELNAQLNAATIRVQRLEEQASRTQTERQSLVEQLEQVRQQRDRKSTRLNSSHLVISYAVFCLKKKNI